MQTPRNSSSAVVVAQEPAQSGAADESLAAPPLRSPAAEALPPSLGSATPSPSSGTSSSSRQDGGASCVFQRRVRRLPAVRVLLCMYEGIKAYPVVGCALRVGEQVASLTNVVYRPLAPVCRWPLACADRCLCKALGVAETVFPCISMHPSQVYYGAQELVTDCVCCPQRTAARCIGSVCPASQN